MKINRFIYIIIIIGCSIFVSHYGGNISYAFFYLSILLPVVSLAYTLYVYQRFKLYQSMDSTIVVKGDWTFYSFVIANEDYITFSNIKVNFVSGKSMIEATDQTTEYSLLPNESDKLQTRLKCNYRGEYYVGVDSVEVTDFLYLFRITYPVGSKLKVTVLPRVVTLDRLGIAPPDQDVKNPRSFSNTAQEELDNEVRKYCPGDSRKRIHWKASARMFELVSRKYQHIPKARIAIFMDLKKVKEEELKVMIAEDKIIESTLAITNYYALRRIPCDIIYDMEGEQQTSIGSRQEFDLFYKACAKIQFQARSPLHELMQERLSYLGEGLFCVVATHVLTKELYVTALQAIARGSAVSIILFSDDISESSKSIMDGMKQSGIGVVQITSEEEIGNALAKEAFS